MEYNSVGNQASGFIIDFEITRPITPLIVRHKVQLLINRNYNRIWEEYGSGMNYLTSPSNQFWFRFIPVNEGGWIYPERLMYSTSKLDAEKEPMQVQLAWAWWRILTVQLLKHDTYNCTIKAQIRAADDQSDSRILI